MQKTLLQKIGERPTTVILLRQDGREAGRVTHPNSAAALAAPVPEGLRAIHSVNIADLIPDNWVEQIARLMS